MEIITRDRDDGAELTISERDLQLIGENVGGFENRFAQAVETEIREMSSDQSMSSWVNLSRKICHANSAKRSGGSSGNEELRGSFFAIAGSRTNTGQLFSGRRY
jgi:hypothetical protein